MRVFLDLMDLHVNPRRPVPHPIPYPSPTHKIFGGSKPWTNNPKRSQTTKRSKRVFSFVPLFKMRMAVLQVKAVAASLLLICEDESASGAAKAKLRVFRPGGDRRPFERESQDLVRMISSLLPPGPSPLSLLPTDQHRRN